MFALASLGASFPMPSLPVYPVDRVWIPRESVAATLREYGYHGLPATGSRLFPSEYAPMTG